MVDSQIISSGRQTVGVRDLIEEEWPRPSVIFINCHKLSFFYICDNWRKPSTEISGDFKRLVSYSQKVVHAILSFFLTFVRLVQVRRARDVVTKECMDLFECRRSAHECA